MPTWQALLVMLSQIKHSDSDLYVSALALTSSFFLVLILGPAVMGLSHFAAYSDLFVLVLTSPSSFSSILIPTIANSVKKPKSP